MKSPRIQTIIFDLDGTIIDSEGVASRVVKDVFSKWNIRLKPEDYMYVVGRTWDEAFQHLMGTYSIPVSQDEAAHLIKSQYRQLIEQELLTVPGVVEAIRQLRDHFTLALVSGSVRSDIEYALKKLGVYELFQVVLGAEDYPKSKPAPDGYLKAMKQLKASPHEVLIFEDSTPGIRSARQAGAWVVAIRATNYFSQDQSEAHDSIEDFRHITHEWVKKWIEKAASTSY